MPIVFDANIDTQWQYLMQYVFNYDEEATAGMLGNFYAESHCLSVCVQPSHFDDAVARQYVQDVNDGTKTKYTFAHDGKGFGLAQWTWYERKDNLYDFCLNTQASFNIGDLLTQLDFVKWEVTHSQSYITMVDNMVNAQGTSQQQVYYCADQVLEIYERPKVYNYETRRNYAMEFYNHYAGTPIVGHPITVIVQNPDGNYGYATSYPQFAEAGTTVILSQRTDEGLTFDGFTSSDVTISAINTFVMPNSAVTVYAHFHGVPVHPPSTDYTIDVQIASNLSNTISYSISETTAQEGEHVSMLLITEMSDDEVAKLDIHANGVQLTITGKLITFYMPAHNVVVTIRRKKRKTLLVAKNPQLLFQIRRYQ